MTTFYTCQKEFAKHLIRAYMLKRKIEKNDTFNLAMKKHKQQKNTK